MNVLLYLVPMALALGLIGLAAFLWSLKSGQYDGVSASGDATLRLIYGGDVAPVNTDLVPNYKTISSFLKNGNWNSVEFLQQVGAVCR